MADTGSGVAPAAVSAHNAVEGSTTDAHYEDAAYYFRPETGEIIEVYEKVAEFAAHGRDNCMAIQDLHDAHEAVSNAFESHAKGGKSEIAIDTASEKLKKANEKAREKLMKVEFKAGGGTIVELLPVMKRPDGSKRQIGKKYTYVHSDKIKSHTRSYKLSEKDKETGKESFLVKDEKTNKIKIDAKKLKEQYALKKAPGKMEGMKSDEFEYVVTGFAEEWNKKLNTEQKYGADDKFGQSIDLDAKAQLMRFAAAAGSSAEWDPGKGNYALKAEGSASFSLIDAKSVITYYLPHRVGWAFTVDVDGQTFELGAYRTALSR